LVGEIEIDDDGRARQRPCRARQDVALGELGIPEGTVKSRVYYALRALRLALEEMGWDDVATR